NGQVVVHADRLTRIANELANPIRITIGVEATDPRDAGRLAEQCHEDPYRGGLARAVRTEEAEDLSAFHGERDPGQCRLAARVDLGQILDRDGGGSLVLHCASRSIGLVWACAHRVWASAHSVNPCGQEGGT